MSQELEFFRSIGIPLKRKHLSFLKKWTWFDAGKAREFSAQGRAEAAGEWARSAARDVLHACELTEISTLLKLEAKSE